MRPEFPERLEGPRVALVKHRPGLGEEMYQAAWESEVELRRWQTWLDAVTAPEVLEEWAQGARARWEAGQSLEFQVLERETERFLGHASLERVRWEIPAMEIGYWLRTSAVGNGFMTEAVGLLRDLALDTLGANRLEIKCDALNERSAAIPLRLGFTLEGVLHNDRRDALGGLQNTMLWALTPGDLRVG